VPFIPGTNAPAAAPSSEQLHNLGQGLFGCAPQTWSSLTPQQRALCPRPGEGVAQDATKMPNPTDRVKDEKHWAAELEKRNSPLVDTCMTFQRHAIAAGVEDYQLMVDPKCAVQKLQKALQ
jgi:hypothetical protein